MSDFEAELTAVFTEQYDADPGTAKTAAANVNAFHEAHAEDLTTEAFLDALDEADIYDGFAHRFDLAIGELAAADDDCTDSREYRLAGFDPFAADESIGTE
ncbi:hypothetical protein [Halosegnis longus]|uniref:Uncharacterized protein n=1 Tax=Halosegnis longus TaxID=2216012 RepID=A0AAJ4UWJ6_9EURY|nr:hypothetical protein Nmn1133_11050 [Salella cibi]